MINPIYHGGWKMNGGKKLSFIAFGDIHENIDNLFLIEKKLRDADLIVISGDITSCGGVKNAQRVLNSVREFNKNIISLAGNMDGRDVLEVLEKEGVLIHGKGKKFGVAGFFGCGGGPISPFRTPFEIDDMEFKETLIKGYEEIKDAEVKILITHAPPFNSKVDLTKTGVHAGCKEVREFIDNFQPDIHICGHIHEARGQDKIQKTLIFNPGPIYNGGYICGEIFEDKSFNIEVVILDRF